MTATRGVTMRLAAPTSRGFRTLVPRAAPAARGSYRMLGAAALTGTALGLLCGHQAHAAEDPGARRRQDQKEERRRRHQEQKEAAEKAQQGSYAYAAAAAVGVGCLAAVFSRFRTVPTNELLVKYGFLHSGSKVSLTTGGGTFVFPIIEQTRSMSLVPMQIHVNLTDALTREKIRLDLPCTFTFGIGAPERHSPDENAEMKDRAFRRAAITLLDHTPTEIEELAQDMIIGQLRAVIATMDVDELNSDREGLNAQIDEMVSKELAKVGLYCVTFNIVNIRDKAGKIEAQGKKAEEAALQKANIEAAKERRLGTVGVEEEEKIQQIEVAKLQAAKATGEKESERDQRKRVAELDADAIQAENLSKMIILESQAQVTMAEAQTYREGETSTVESRAAVAESRAIAETKTAIAEANRREATERADLEAPAKALKAKVIVDAEASRERQTIEAKGRADATLLQKEAEAQGEYLLLAKKADGLKMIVDACGGADKAFQLMMLEHVEKIAETSATAISNIKFDKVTVWDTGAGAGGAPGTGSTANFIKSLATALPPTMDIVESVAGVSLPKMQSLPTVEDLKKGAEATEKAINKAA